eukprot:jgi/Bigna1/129914/aug1.10_g4622
MNRKIKISDDDIKQMNVMDPDRTKILDPCHDLAYNIYYKHTQKATPKDYIAYRNMNCKKWLCRDAAAEYKELLEEKKTLQTLVGPTSRSLPMSDVLKAQKAYYRNELSKIPGKIEKFKTDFWQKFKCNQHFTYRDL